METQQFQKSLDPSLPIFMLKNISLLGGDTKGTRNREEQQGLGWEGGVKKDEKMKKIKISINRPYKLDFSLRSKKLLEIDFYFILLYFCYVLKSISCLKKMKLMINYVKIPQLNFPLS